MNSNRKLHLLASTAMLYVGTALSAPLLKPDSTILVIAADADGTKYLIRTTPDIAGMLNLKVSDVPHAQVDDFVAAAIDIVSNLQTDPMALAFGRLLNERQITDGFELDTSDTGDIQQAEIKTLVDLKVDAHGVLIIAATGADANIVDSFGLMQKVHVMNSFGVTPADQSSTQLHADDETEVNRLAAATPAE